MWLFLNVLAWLAGLLHPVIQLIERFFYPEMYRLGKLPPLIRKTWRKGDHNQAEILANEYLVLVEQFKNDPNYRDGMQLSHQIKGLLRLKEGAVEQAGEHLLEAGRSPSFLQLEYYGPRMTLARELLLKGEKQIVLQYLDLLTDSWATERDFPKEIKAKRNVSKLFKRIITEALNSDKLAVKENKLLIQNWKAQVRKGRVPKHRLWQ